MLGQMPTYMHTHDECKLAQCEDNASAQNRLSTGGARRGGWFLLQSTRIIRMRGKDARALESHVN
eukprot:5956286-Pyramimonas_sp.AAC.1